MNASILTGFMVVVWLLTTAGALFRQRGRAAQHGMRFLVTLLGVIAAVPAVAQSPFAAGPPGVALSA
jgi:hypothetical protein